MIFLFKKKKKKFVFEFLRLVVTFTSLTLVMCLSFLHYRYLKCFINFMLGTLLFYFKPHGCEFSWWINITFVLKIVVEIFNPCEILSHSFYLEGYDIYIYSINFIHKRYFFFSLINYLIWLNTKFNLFSLSH